MCNYDHDDLDVIVSQRLSKSQSETKIWTFSMHVLRLFVRALVRSCLVWQLLLTLPILLLVALPGTTSKWKGYNYAFPFAKQAVRRGPFIWMCFYSIHVFIEYNLSVSKIFCNQIFQAFQPYPLWYRITKWCTLATNSNEYLFNIATIGSFSPHLSSRDSSTASLNWWTCVLETK